MNNLVNTFIERKSDFFKALFEHLQISLVALLIAMLIAIPLAILINKNKKLTEFMLQLTGIMQTIPSLALLGLFIPIFGIGIVPAVIALVIYAIFPIMQATVTGLNEIDPSLLEASEAFGMTEWEKLKKYKLEIAMPVIVSGVRTSAVMVIGTATLAALVGAGGLGSFILLGIDRNDSSLILIGAISSALLAILFSVGINALKKQRMKNILRSLLIMVLVLAISFVPFGAKKNDKLVIAGKLGAEPEILINMYKYLIEENTDIEVEIKPNFGKTSFLYEAVKSGDIDIYPEFTGTVVSSLLKEKVEVSNDPRKVYELARDEIAKQDDLALLEPMTYQNTYALAVKRDYAEEHKLKSISDLKKVEDEIVAGFTLEFNDRDDGNKGLKSLYNLDLEVKTMEPSLRYQAIDSGEVQLVDAYSTESNIKRYDLVVLEDDLGLFPPYQGAALMKIDTLDKYPQIKDILEQLSGKITEEEIIDMNYDVDVKGRSAKDVAIEFIKENIE